MFGISGSEFLVLLLVLVVVIGPQRLPEYTRKLTQWVRQLRVFLDDAKAQIAEEVGPELADLNLQDLNPRNYDPRKIVRDALGEDLDAIRRDLTQPFESFSAAAKESGDAAAKAVKEDTSSRHGGKSLTSMIDEKAEEARKATENPKVAAAGAATAAAGARLAAAQQESTTDTQDVSDAQDVEVTAPAEDATAEATQAGAVGTEGAEGTEDTAFDVGSLTQEQVEAAVGAARGAAVLPGLSEESTARHRAARELTDDAAFALAPAQPQETEQAEDVKDPGKREMITGAVDAVVGAAQAVEEVVDLVPDEEIPSTDAVPDEEIPSTLASGTDAPRGGRPRPLSPRDVLSASRAARRTPREALTAVVD